MSRTRRRRSAQENPGLFCCGKCTVGFWRNLLAGGLDRREERLQHGVQHLRSMRDADHGWRKFPFWYTVLALSEIDSGEAKAELKYAAPALERASSFSSSASSSACSAALRRPSRAPKPPTAAPGRASSPCARPA